MFVSRPRFAHRICVIMQFVTTWRSLYRSPNPVTLPAAVAPPSSGRSLYRSRVHVCPPAPLPPNSGGRSTAALTVALPKNRAVALPLTKPGHPTGGGRPAVVSAVVLPPQHLCIYMCLYVFMVMYVCFSVHFILLASAALARYQALSQVRFLFC